MAVIECGLFPPGRPPLQLRKAKPEGGEEAEVELALASAARPSLR